MYSQSGNIKLTSHNDINKVVDKLFDSLHLRCQGNLETSMRGSDFIFHSVQLIYNKWHRKCRSGGYIY